MSEINYQDIDQNISIIDIHKYYEKIKIFDYFKPNGIFFGDTGTVEYEKGKWFPIGYYEYDDYIKTINNKKCIYIGQKEPLSNKSGYLYDFKIELTENFDHIDDFLLNYVLKEENILSGHKNINSSSKECANESNKEIQDNTEKELKTDDNNPKVKNNNHNKTIKKLEIFGLHSCGYHGFFRPNIFEVITLLNTKITTEDLKTIERIYVTTEPHPSSKIYECFDPKKNKHRAKTTCYVITSHDQKFKKRKIE